MTALAHNPAPMAFASLAFEPFVARRPWVNGHLQTMRNLVRPTPRVEAAAHRRLVLPVDEPGPDHPPDHLALVLDLPAAIARGRPLVVLVHGLGGCEDSTYMKTSSRFFLQAGAPVVRVNLRGSGPSQIAARDWSHAGRYGDLERLLPQLDVPHPAEGLVLIGYSLGGNLSLNFLGRGLVDRRLRAAATVSAPLDMPEASLAVHAPRNRIYHDYLLRALKRDYLNPFSRLDGSARRRVAAAPTLKAVDDVLTAPHHGFAGADHYYAEVSSGQYLDQIATPTLLVHGKDDPFVPATPYAQARRGACLPVVAEGGGHVGFHDAGGLWHLRQIQRFFEAVGAW